MPMTWWSKHRTKTLGFIVTLVGAIQVNLIAIQSLISPRTFGLITMILGVLVSLVGFINSHREDAANDVH